MTHGKCNLFTLDLWFIPLSWATCTRTCFVQKCLLFLQRTSWANPWPPEVHEGRGISDGAVSQLHIGIQEIPRFKSIILPVERSQVSTPGYLESTWSTAWRITQLSTAEVLCIHAHDSDLLRYSQLLPSDPPMPFQKCWKRPSLEDFVLSLGCDPVCARQVFSGATFIAQGFCWWRSGTFDRMTLVPVSGTRYIPSRCLGRQHHWRAEAQCFHRSYQVNKNADRSRNNFPNLRFESSICLASFVWGLKAFRFCQLCLLVYCQRLDDHWLIWPLLLPTTTIRSKIHYGEHLWSCNCHRSPFARIPRRRIVSQPPACCVLAQVGLDYFVALVRFHANRYFNFISPSHASDCLLQHQSCPSSLLK